jgi:hypothetical protein
MLFSWSLRMGCLDVGVHVFAPQFQTEIEQLISSLSFGLQPSSQKDVHVVFVNPDAPEEFVDLIELPEWGKCIYKNLYKISKAAAQDKSLQSPDLSDFSKAVNFGPKDWFSPELKAFFYYNPSGQLICFPFNYGKKSNRAILLNRISGYIYFLATYWYASHNGLLLHSAGVARGENGYLFLGEGGAGKSTTSSLSTSVGVDVLSDDLSFVIHTGDGRYEQAAAPGPFSRFTTNPRLHPRLRGIFRLVKDTRDHLVPISPIETAHIIFRSFEWSEWVDSLPPETITQAFHTACDIAQRIPGYELHLRKSPDFWKLIDAQFAE